jgi:MATE family multidrug resistance protein
MTVATALQGRRAEEAGSVGHHLRQTLWITLPIAAALLSEIGMGLITTLMLGGLGDRALAAGSFATNLFITALLVLQGALSGVSVLSADRLGAGRGHEVPGLYWSGVALAAALAVPMFAGLSLCGKLLLAVGQPAILVDDVVRYLHVLRWAVPAGVVGIGMMRQVLPALGLQRVLLWVMPCGVALHAGLNQLLIHGGLGVPALGLEGSALATVLSLSTVAVAMLVFLHGPRFGRAVAPTRPDLAHLRRLVAIGLPVSGIVTVEAGLFLATGLLAGTLGPSALAAHMIALSVCSVSFMVPLAISQTANVRVASAIGAGRMAEARRAGFCAIVLAAGFMACSALVLSLAPHLVLRLYLGPLTAANAVTGALAIHLLRVAGLFQIADGTQVAACGALRGLQDVRVPMLLASGGYWGIGFSAGWVLAFRAGLGVVGLWWGLCAGLGVVAAAMTLRFALRSRSGAG